MLCATFVSIHSSVDYPLIGQGRQLSVVVPGAPGPHADAEPARCGSSVHSAPGAFRFAGDADMAAFRLCRMRVLHRQSEVDGTVAVPPPSERGESSCGIRVPGKSAGQEEAGSELMAFVLWILAVILVVSGIVALFRKQMLWGIVLIIVGLAVGPGGVSIFT